MPSHALARVTRMDSARTRTPDGALHTPHPWSLPTVLYDRTQNANPALSDVHFESWPPYN